MIDRQKKSINNTKNAIEEGEDRLTEAIHETEDRLKEGREQMTKMAKDLDKQAHENPWMVVAGVGVGCLLLGLILGKSR